MSKRFLHFLIEHKHLDTWKWHFCFCFCLSHRFIADCDASVWTALSFCLFIFNKRIQHKYMSSIYNFAIRIVNLILLDSSFCALFSVVGALLNNYNYKILFAIFHNTLRLPFVIHKMYVENVSYFIVCLHRLYVPFFRCVCIFLSFRYETDE